MSLSNEHFQELREQEENGLPAKITTQLKPINLAAIKPLQSHKEAMVDMLIIAVGEGVIKAEELAVKLKFLTEVFESTRTLLNEQIRRAVELNGEPLKVMGATIEKAEVGTVYDYSNDPVWCAMKAHVAPLLKDIKDREATLKTLKKPFVEVDDQGEVLTIPPPVKTSTSSIKITLGK